MTFAEGVYRLVHIADHHYEGAAAGPSAASVTRAPSRGTEAAAVLSPAAAPSIDLDESADAPALDEAELEQQPGLPDLEASVALVASGVATRIVLTGFPSWPGLLWRAYQLADNSDVMIIPTVVRPGGKVDIVIARSDAAIV